MKTFDVTLTSKCLKIVPTKIQLGIYLTFCNTFSHDFNNLDFYLVL